MKEFFIKQMDKYQYIRSMEIIRHKIDNEQEFPFCLPVIKHMRRLYFHPKVTYIIDENGSGKSTLLEAIATEYGFNPEGGTKNFNFASWASHSVLHNYIKLIKGVKKPKDGFFLRAETFYNLATTIEELDQDNTYGSKIIDSYGGRSLSFLNNTQKMLKILMENE